MSKFAYVSTCSIPVGKGYGIYIYKVDPANGSLTFLENVETQSGAPFLCFNEKRDRLYAVTLLNQDENGGIVAFQVDSSTGKLTKLNEVSSLGKWSCHLCLDPSEKFVLAANYFSGSVAIYSLKPDGALNKNTDLVTNTGSGPNRDRQESAHAHMITFDHRGKQAILVDLGIDKTLFYEFNSSNGKLVRPPGGHCNAVPGAGPRHMVESQDGRYYYIIHELNSTISVYSSKRSNGEHPLLQTISTLPAGDVFQGTNTASEIALHPNGKFLFGGNRGHDSIVSYAIDGKTGLLTLVGHEPTQGSFPMHFQIDPEGRFLYVANLKSDSIIVLCIDPSTGKLTPTGTQIHVPSPICIVFK